MARVPGGSGVRRPNRSVSLDDARNPEVGSLDAPLLAAQSSVSRDSTSVPSPSGAGFSDWISDFLKSRLGQLLGSGSLPELQRGAAEQLTGLATPPTPAGQMAAPKVAGYVEGALDLGRPLALADLGVGGTAGMMMLPFPGLGAADDAARPVVRMARGLSDDASIRTFRQTDRPRVRMNAEAAAEGTRLREMIQDPTIRSRWWKEATESVTPIKVGEDAAQLPHGARVNLDEVLEYGEKGGSRMIVQVKLADGTTQPFYRSTGVNSGQRGGWFPLDGIQTAPGDMGRGWFIKQAGHPNLTGELAEIAQALKAHGALGRIRPTLFFSGAGATNEIETINVLLGRTGKV